MLLNTASKTDSESIVELNFHSWSLVKYVLNFTVNLYFTFLHTCFNKVSCSPYARGKPWDKTGLTWLNTVPLGLCIWLSASCAGHQGAGIKWCHAVKKIISQCHYRELGDECKLTYTLTINKVQSYTRE